MISDTNSDFEWPQTLHHILATPSSIFPPFESYNHMPFADTISGKEVHSDICVFGCHKGLRDFI